jgi:hypothetical protein
MAASMNMICSFMDKKSGFEGHADLRKQRFKKPIRNMAMASEQGRK